MKQEKLTGSDAFEKYYSELFGDRWNILKQALLGEPVYCEYDAGGEKKYFLDPGSVMAAQCLPVKGAQKLLDMCAAPGGKTLVLAHNMDDDACLDSNERSPDRKQRLDKVVLESLPSSVSKRIKTSCSDSATWCKRQTECYDRILLDAPCSSERHVLSDPKYLNMWTPSRIKTLSMEQWALLSSGFRLLAPDGFLLYATCALSPKENDEVVERLFKKFDNAEIREPDFENAEIKFEFMPEKTKYGWHVLPDKCNGCGPLYFALIYKKLH